MGTVNTNAAKETIDFGLITSSQSIVNRIKTICNDNNYTLKVWDSLEKYIEEDPICYLVVASTMESSSKEGAAEYAQAVKQMNKDAFLVCLVGKKLPKETSMFLKKSGSNVNVMEDELYDTSKLEYIASQIIKSQYIPIKVSDLTPNSPTTFDIYHFLPIKRKFIKFAFKGDELGPEKMQKITQVGEIYIHKSQVSEFFDYSAKDIDNSSKTIIKRCRNQFLALESNYVEFIFNVTDQSEQSSFSEGIVLFEKLKKIGEGLVASLAEFGDVGAIVNSMASSEGDGESLNRTSAIAAQAAMLGIQMDAPSISNIMMGALLTDLGLLFLKPDVTKKIQKKGIDSLTKEERDVYEQHPKVSLEIILKRRLPLEPKLRDIIVSTHERYDGTGFPAKMQESRISEEAQLIQFVADLDSKALIRVGQQRVDREKLKKELLANETKKGNRYSPQFLERLKKAIYAFSKASAAA